MVEHRQITVISGANRGLGLETARQLAVGGYRVVLTSRDPDKGAAAVAALARQDLQIEYQQLDITHAESVQGLARAMQERFGGVDVLVNNAGIFIESQSASRSGAATALAGDLELVRRTLETNLLGTIALTQALVPLMRGSGRVVNVSSGMGQLAEMEGGWPGYRLSKAALNAYTRMLAAELVDTGIKVNAVCPGWVRTDMGGPGADRSLARGADTIVWAATLPDDGPSGGFFRDRKPIAW